MMQLESQELDNEKMAYHQKPSDARIWSVCLVIASLAGLIIMTVLLLSKYSPSSYGWVAVFGASFVFGSTGIPMKMSSLEAPDSVLFASYCNLGIALISLPVLIYLLATDTFTFYPFAILGAAILMTISYFSFNAVRLLGYAVAPAIWAGIGMTVAYILGVTAFEESIRFIPGAAIALALLITGVALISLSQQREEVSLISPKATPSIAILYCIITGIFDGSLMVPFKLSKAVALREVLSYIASFGIGAVAVTPVMFTLYVIFILRGRVPDFYLGTVLGPGVLSGSLWGCANFLSVNATYSLVIMH